MGTHHDEDPVLITSARRSSDAEYQRRRKKYAIMMACRALAVIVAAACYHVSIWISVACLVAGAVLPWCAVLIANDNPPKSKQVDRGSVDGPVERALPGAVDPSRTIDG